MNREVVESAATFLGISVEELLERHDNYLQYQLARWHQLSAIDAAALADYYNDNLYLYELISTPRFGIVRLIEPFLQPGSAILDYGSGIGTHGLHFLSLGHRVTFMDLPSPHFDYIRWYTSRSNLHANFVETSAADSLPENSFDAIFCFDVLEHVLDWRETIQQFSRLLKPDGKLFLIVSFVEFEEHAIHISSQTGLTEASFRECMEQCGLVEIFRRDRPVPLSHPEEPFTVFARTASERASRMVELFKAGEAHEGTGSWAEAERCFAEIVAWNPQDFSAHRALARIFLAQGKLSEAAAEVGLTLQLLPDDIDALELSADLHMKSGNRSEAGRQYVEAIALWPEQAVHSRQMLAQLLKQGEPFEPLCSPNADWRKRLALLSYLIGIRRFTDAEALAGSLTAIHAKETYRGYLVWKEYARLLREKGHVAEAIGVLQSLIPHHQGRPWIHFDLSLCHSSTGNNAAALAELDEEQAVSPFRAGIHFEKGMAWRRLGDYRRARASFTEALALAPESGEALLERAHAALLLGDRFAALADLKRVTELMPDRFDLHLELALLELSLRHFRKGMGSLSVAYRLAPNKMMIPWLIVRKLVRAAGGVVSRARG